MSFRGKFWRWSRLKKSELTSEPACRLNLAVKCSRSKGSTILKRNVEHEASSAMMDCEDVSEHKNFDEKEICISVTLIKSPTTLHGYF